MIVKNWFDWRLNDVHKVTVNIQHPVEQYSTALQAINIVSIIMLKVITVPWIDKSVTAKKHNCIKKRRIECLKTHKENLSAENQMIIINYHKNADSFPSSQQNHIFKNHKTITATIGEYITRQMQDSY